MVKWWVLYGKFWQMVFDLHAWEQVEYIIPVCKQPCHLVYMLYSCSKYLWCGSYGWWWQVNILTYMNDSYCPSVEDLQKPNIESYLFTPCSTSGYDRWVITIIISYCGVYHLDFWVIHPYVIYSGFFLRPAVSILLSWYI